MTPSERFGVGLSSELPDMATAHYVSNTYAGDYLGSNNVARQAWGDTLKRKSLVMPTAGAAPPLLDAIDKLTKGQILTVTPRRLVQIYIADTNISVPLKEALVYSGNAIFTDLTDQELFWEIDVKAVLAKHNEARVTFRDKSIKDKDTKLEPARVRDLKMTVVEIATF